MGLPSLRGGGETLEVAAPGAGSKERGPWCLLRKVVP